MTCNPKQHHNPVQRNASRCPRRGRRNNYTTNARGGNLTEYIYQDVFVYYLTLNGFKCWGAIKGNLV